MLDFLIFIGVSLVVVMLVAMLVKYDMFNNDPEEYKRFKDKWKW